MRSNRKTAIAVFVVAVLALAVPGTALAAGTTANTTVTNTVLLNWNAGAVAYSTTDTASFVVDRLVTFTVTNQTAAGLTVDVYPGTAGGVGVNVMAFDVANASNTDLDFAISALNTGDAVTSARSVYWDDDRSGAYDGTEPLITALDNVPADSTWRVFVVADISSAGGTAAWVENIDLRAQALDTAGVVITASAGAWQATTLQSVLADLAGTAAADADYDGYHSDRGYYRLVSPSLTVTKSITGVSDTSPATGAGEDKAIPGATVGYRIVVENVGTGDATGVSLTDTLSPSIEVATDVGSITPSTGSTSTVDNVAPAADEILWTIGTVAPATSVNLTYDLTIP